MTDPNYVSFNRRESQRLADLSSIAGDLRETVQFCQIAIDQYDSIGTAQTRLVLLDALCAAALIRYFRAFGKGVRERPDKLLSILSPEERQQHTTFKEYRDKWIAHSVNGFEGTSIRAHFAPAAHGALEVARISVAKSRVMSMSPHQIQQLMRLAHRLEQSLATMLFEENARVLEFAKTLDPRILNAEKKAGRKPKRLSTANPSKQRKRWR